MTAASGDTHAATDELRAQWQALADAETLHMLPVQALVASVKDLAAELLSRTASSPPDSLRARLETLRGLSEAATPGPWTPATAPNEDSTETAREYHDSLLMDEGRPLWVLWAKDGSTDVDYVVPSVTGDGPTSEANSEFIAALVNLYRELLAEDAAVNHVRAGLEASAGSAPSRGDQ